MKEYFSEQGSRLSERCELCGRQIVALTKHHLIPRARHHNKKTRKRFDRSAMTMQVAWLCRPCHKQVHALFSEKELAESYYKIETLRQHVDIQAFVEWVSKKPEDYVPRTYNKRR